VSRCWDLEEERWKRKGGRFLDREERSEDGEEGSATMAKRTRDLDLLILGSSLLLCWILILN